MEAKPSFVIHKLLYSSLIFQKNYKTLALLWVSLPSCIPQLLGRYLVLLGRGHPFRGYLLPGQTLRTPPTQSLGVLFTQEFSI